MKSSWFTMISRRVAIVGYGCIKIGKYPDKSEASLTSDSDLSTNLPFYQELFNKVLIFSRIV